MFSGQMSGASGGSYGRDMDAGLAWTVVGSVAGVAGVAGAGLAATPAWKSRRRRMPARQQGTAGVALH
jgi:hypothetical protein